MDVYYSGCVHSHIEGGVHLSYEDKTEDQKETQITVLFLSKKLKVTAGKSQENHLIQQMFNFICMKKKEES